ncbi:ZPR1-type zinc finger-containing protein [Heterostelium album PN500]|uniref:ZPR1-type zinc finger-containing protein n=1 Tax=Heterostelium pallidum (strain ATCC 26659 / Pp 5 / PN500) TaxID=670386 RepID=D3BEA4_HETP5|nr:ZPR1-type zinc finger-containing protein [Heterostelium album PN500]EFA80235.1 ZPR1-type zinc finger-containing protein [Heterostelium album PN500]|eukprot:XP_020432355.1 ZPR1-type zinc finger-containing protein [Heterostelium album PN500]
MTDFELHVIKTIHGNVKVYLPKDGKSGKIEKGSMSDTDTTQQPPEEFKDLSHTSSVEEIESLCMNCHYEQGITKILLTKIPFFREIILLAFECPECGFKSSEVQSGGAIADKGVHIELNLQSRQDMNRQIVKMDSATISIPILDFEIPPSTQRGCLNTIEGFIQQSIEGLNQAARLKREDGDIESATKIVEFVTKLVDLMNVEKPFTIVIDDPSGNSYVENPMAPKADPNLTITKFARTAEQNAMLGLQEQVVAEPQLTNQPLEDREVLHLPNSCTFCGHMGVINMVMTDIPYFKNVVLMAFNCEECGYKTNEIKPGGAIEPTGRILTLRVETAEDLSRDVLKSETANAILKELDIEITHGSLGGRFTTIEGLLSTIREELEKNPFFRGDSADVTTRTRYNEIMGTLDAYINGEKKFTLIIDDPVSNSYIQSLYAPDPDPNLDSEDYERTFDQNEELGLNDINTENYRNIDKNEEEQEQEGKEEKQEENKELKESKVVD